MSSLVMEIEDYELEAGKPTAVSRRATYFLLMIGSDVDVTFSYKGSRIGGGKGLQGGDAVGPLSQPYDQVTMTSATAQTVKVATSSDPVTITRLSGTVKVDGVVATKPDFAASIQNEGFFTASNLTGVAGEYSAYALWNPQNSGKNLIVFDLAISTQQNAFMVVYELTALPAALKFEKKASPQLLGGIDGASEVYAGNQVQPWGGAPEIGKTLFANDVPAFHGWQRQPTFPAVAPPGFGILMTVNNTGIPMSPSIGFLEVNQ